MARLLDLPPELRLDIYAIAISSRPDIINIDDGTYGGSYYPPRSFMARSLAAVDFQLCEEIQALYWSSNVFGMYRTGPGSYDVCDFIFHRWLKYVAKGSAKDVRRLKFKDVSSLPSPDMVRHDQSCINEIDVDLKARKASIWNRKLEKCTCDHAGIILSRLETIFSRIPELDGQRQVTTETLWDVYEVYYLFHPVRNRLRSWHDWEQGYDD